MTKKESIDSTAKDLFWKHGFKKISIDEICKKSHVSRKTFYTYYENKNALVVFILESFTNTMMSNFKTLVYDTNLSFSQKMNDMLNMKIEYNKDFSMEFVADFLHPDSTDLLTYFNQLMQESLQLTRDFFSQSQQKGDLNPLLNIDFLIWYFQKQLEICSAPEALAFFPNVESMTLQLSELMIFGITRHKNI